jgi:uncharacterized protein
MNLIDLSKISIIDNHCHPILRDQSIASVADWRSRFSEAADASTREHHVPFTVFYRRLIRAMARFHNSDASEEAVLAVRESQDRSILFQRLGSEANVDTLVMDIGFPQRAHVTPNRDFAASFGCRYVELLRLELMFQDLVKTHRTLDQAREALLFELRDLRASGFCGVKSIAGYRTGLDVQLWPRAEAEKAFAAAREEAAERGDVRLGYKPVLDTLLRDSLTIAARQNLPAQFHVGYGDPDVDLRQANPLHLRSLIADQAFAGVSFVLLHACWPFFREGAFLATVYPNVYLDLSYAIPFFGFSEYVAATRAALAVAPWTKILFSSDAACIPELHWIGAIDGRRAVGQALDQFIGDGDLTRDEAMQAAQCILHDNAVELYGCS